MNACVCLYIHGLFLPFSDTPSMHCCSHFADKETEGLGGEDEKGQGRGEGGPKDAGCDQGRKVTQLAHGKSRIEVNLAN